MVKRSNTSNKSKLSILENNSNNISTNSNNLELNSSKSNNLLDILNASNINNLNNISTLLADIKLLTEDEVKKILTLLILDSNTTNKDRLVAIKLLGQEMGLFNNKAGKAVAASGGAVYKWATSADVVDVETVHVDSTTPDKLQ